MTMKAYEILVEQVLEKLESGVVPWRQTWIGGIPSNFVSEKSYRGFNRLILSFTEFEDKRFLTLKQIRKLGGKLRKGSKGIKVFYFTTREDENGEDLPPIVRYYTVFNIEQTKGISYSPKLRTRNEQVHKNAQAIISGYKDRPISYEGNRASYNLVKDTITMPSLYKFKKDEDFFATLFHEYVHSTGNPKRLGRSGMETIEHFGSESYSKEELVAELGSMFLCHEAGITSQTFDNSVSYLKGWLSYLKDHKKELIHASGQAQKACDYILGQSISQ